jgi:hypothetical protein
MITLTKHDTNVKKVSKYIKDKKSLEHIKRKSKEIRRKKEKRNGIEEKDGNEMKYRDFINLGGEMR